MVQCTVERLIRKAWLPGDIIGAIEKAIPDNQEKGSQMVKAMVAGTIDINVDIPAMQMAIPVIEANIPGGKVVLKGHWQDGALVYSGK